MPNTAPDGHLQHHHQQRSSASKMDSPSKPPAGSTTLPASTSAGTATHGITAEKASSMTVSEALHHSYRVGLSGAGAMSFSVVTLMWLHTIVTYQQRHGTTFRNTFRELWRAGGVRRFYRGMIPALVVAPLCRFGDTLSNEMAMIWLQGQHARRESRRAEDKAVGPALPVWLATVMGSAGAAAFHAMVVPLDTYKVVLQVEGKKGLDVIKKRLALRGPVAIYDGALAFAGGSFMGHYPWYLTYNMLEQSIPQTGDARERRIRSAFIGVSASIVSAAASNAFRVLKVYRQSHHRPDGLSYLQSIVQIVKKDGGGARGAIGVLSRGLAGRMAGSALQGLVFNVAWQEISVWCTQT